MSISTGKDLIKPKQKDRKNKWKKEAKAVDKTRKTNTHK